MKRVLVSILVLTLLLSWTAALAESAQSQDFSFHNGVRFNMTVGEVNEIEVKNGFEWGTDTISAAYGVHYANGNVLGIDDARLCFYFSNFSERLQPEGIEDGHLLGCTYLFRYTECFNLVYEAMTKKYGPATYGENNGQTIADLWEGDGFHRGSWIIGGEGHPNKNKRQWIIPYGDSCILIDLYDEYNELFGAGWYQTTMSYYVLSVAEYEAILNATERINNDI